MRTMAPWQLFMRLGYRCGESQNRDPGRSSFRNYRAVSRREMPLVLRITRLNFTGVIPDSDVAKLLSELDQRFRVFPSHPKVAVLLSGLRLDDAGRFTVPLDRGNDLERSESDAPTAKGPAPP
jgi:hypothetical protein